MEQKEQNNLLITQVFNSPSYNLWWVMQGSELCKHQRTENMQNLCPKCNQNKIICSVSQSEARVDLKWPIRGKDSWLNARQPQIITNQSWENTVLIVTFSLKDWQSKCLIGQVVQLGASDWSNNTLADNKRVHWPALSWYLQTQSTPSESLQST